MTVLHVGSSLSPREGLVYQAVRKAVESQRHVRLMNVDELSLDRPLGLSQIDFDAPVIALGISALEDLADVWKSALVGTSPSKLEAGERSIQGDKLQRLFWSCCHTRKLVALGSEAWQFSQLLPFNKRRRYATPPLSIPPALSHDGIDVIHVISHETDMRRARDLANMLRRTEIADVRFADASMSPDFSQPFYSGAGAFHIHVGRHTADSNEVRIIDSLSSGCIVLELSDAFGEAADCLAVIDEETGFVRSNEEAIRQIYEEIRYDTILRRKIIERGIVSVAKLNSSWQTIAADLVAKPTSLGKSD